MMIDTDALREQMKNGRYRDGRFERLENGAWAPWPVLALDKYGRDEAKRAAVRQPRRHEDG